MKRKILFGFLALILVLVVVLLWVPSTTWLTLLLRPSHDFDRLRVPEPPDYKLAEAWAALPDRDDLADLLPRGIEPVPGPRAADAFYIHPTTYYASEEWNGAIDEPRAAEMRDLTIANQASAFNACCRVYAPKYRQASIGAYFGWDQSNLSAFRVAYDDVAAAFRHYLASYNDGRPFIIAAHSQGTQHALRLVSTIAKNDELRRRLVAAYVVGYRANPESLGGLPFCREPYDVGCAVAWDTFAEDFETRDELPFHHWRGDRMVRNQGLEWLCTNPISWLTDGEMATSESHLGSVLLQLNVPMTSFEDVVMADEPIGMEVTGLSAPEPRSVGARCSGGRLLIPRQTKPFRADFEATAGSYHLFDYDLFYMDIRQNAVDRVDAWLAQHEKKTE